MTEAADEAAEVLGGEMTESLVLISLSSSLIVSNIFEVLCLITVTYCGGATSMKNLAMREFAIFLEVFRKKRKLKDGKVLGEKYC